MTVRGRLGAGLLLAGLLAGTGAQAADEKKDEQRWRFRLEANTDFPLGVGARVAVVSPWRLHLSTTVDYLVPGYVQGGNAVMVGVGLYDQRKADFIDNALRSSITWRTHLGVQPFATAGFYIEAGYGLLALGGQANPEDAITTIIDILPPEGESALDRQYRIRALVHQLDLELGWRWKLGTSNWSIRAALGGTFTLDSNTRVEPLYEPSDSIVVDAFSRLAENRMDTTFEKYGYVPSLSLSVGYTF